MPRESASSSEPHISRIDTTSTLGRHAHGYQVCISHRDRIVTRFFEDDACAGRTAALRAARMFRDEAMKRLGMTIPPKASGPTKNGLSSPAGRKRRKGRARA